MGVVAALQPAIIWEDVAIVDICIVFFGSMALFHCMPVGRQCDCTPDSWCVPLCSRRIVMQTALQTATAVFSSRELVSFWERGFCCN